MKVPHDATTDPALGSWLEVQSGSDFPIQNLPFGAFVRDGAARLGVALGDRIVDLRVLAQAGLFAGFIDAPGDVFAAPDLSRLLTRNRRTWSALRARISALLSAGNRELHDAGLAESALVRRNDATLVLPFAIGDYVDFYSSLEHATNLGKILRPGGEPLLPNWRYLPVGYHGRAGTVVVSGTPLVRPRGQAKAPDAPAPVFGPTRMLDFELELGFVTGNGPPLGTPIPLSHARERIFGAVLVNDWSARDIQAWEYQPLGPFLGKSFATSISPWVVSLDALEPYRVAGPVQNPPPLDYLKEEEPRGYDIELSVELESAAMRVAGTRPQTVTRVNFCAMYWSMAQQIAHLTSNGATVRAGDFCASGTISGSEPGSYGSLIELTWRGTNPLALADGSARAFLEDGDAVTMRGFAPSDGTRARIGFGEVCGTIAPAG